MENVLYLFMATLGLMLSAVFCWTMLSILLCWPKIVIGTISQKTIDYKSELEKCDYKIIHADDFRNMGFDYQRSSGLALKSFLWNVLFFKEVALFTSNPIFLEKKILKPLVYLELVFDKRIDRIENIGWAKDLPSDYALNYLPAYFSKFTKNEKYEQAAKRVEVFLEELKRYPDNRFLPKKKQFDFGHLGTIIPKN